MDEIERKRVNFTIRLAYSMGHIFNDLTSAMWFSYTLLFFQKIVLFEPLTSGGLILLGNLFILFIYYL